MSASGKFVARILETSASGFAGLTAGLLIERHPELDDRYRPDGFSSWKAQMQQWLLDLSASLAAGEPKLFASRILWTRKAFVARQASPRDLHVALEALRDILQERLPEGSAGPAVSTVSRALEAFSEPGPADEGDLDPGSPAGRAALSYLKTILEGDPRGAVDQLLRAVDDGTPVRDVYLDVLIPAQREAGRMWHAGELSIAEEHVITTTTQRAMAILCERSRPSSRRDGTVVLACVAGNAHDIGIRAIADFFEMAGWHAINLGPDVPHDEIARSVQFFSADIVVLAASLAPHIQGVRGAIERIAAIEDRDVKVIVGGPAFQELPDLWRKIGAHGYSATVEDVEPLGTRLLES